MAGAAKDPGFDPRYDPRFQRGWSGESTDAAVPTPPGVGAASAPALAGPPSDPVQPVSSEVGGGEALGRTGTPGATDAADPGDAPGTDGALSSPDPGRSSPTLAADTEPGGDSPTADPERSGGVPGPRASDAVSADRAHAEPVAATGADGDADRILGIAFAIAWSAIGSAMVVAGWAILLLVNEDPFTTPSQAPSELAIRAFAYTTGPPLLSAGVIGIVILTVADGVRRVRRSAGSVRRRARGAR